MYFEAFKLEILMPVVCCFLSFASEEFAPFQHYFLSAVVNDGMVIYVDCAFS